MGQMRDSDWSRQILLRSDWLPTIVAMCTTYLFCQKWYLNGKGLELGVEPPLIKPY